MSITAKPLYAIILALNAFILLMYARDAYNFYNDTNYNGNGIRYFIRFVVFDIMYAILLILFFPRVPRKIFLLILLLILLQNMNLGFVNYLPVTGLIISAISSILLMVLYVKENE